MSFRYMRIMVFFDLPTITLEDKRAYRNFRKHLINSGFLMLQESVYCKLALNNTVAEGIVESIKQNKPKQGVVQMITVTEKQFSKMEYLVGSKTSRTVDTTERLLIL